MSIAPAKPIYGPFTDTEVSIYCDESRHEGQSHQKYMVIGGLWLPRAQRGEILAGLREIQARNGIGGDMKWSKVSKAKLAGYQEIVSFIAARPDVHFRCIVVDKSKVDHEKFFKNDRQLGFWVFYWHCLNQWMGNLNTYFVSIDFKPEGINAGPRRLREILEKGCVKRCWVKSLECVDSHQNPFCQVADMFIGAVGYEQNGLSGSALKQKLAAHIAAQFKRPDLKGTDQPSRQHFNIWRIWS